MIEIINISNKEKIKKIKQRSQTDFDKVLTRIKPVIRDVKVFGDRALFKYTKLYDCFQITKNTIKISKREIKEAYKKLSKQTIKSIKEAAKNIKAYSKQQLPKPWKKEFKKGMTLGQVVRPLDKVGCYVPAGSYSLPSTVLMTVIPAKVAGVKEVIVCSPPKPNNYAILVAADIAGADAIYRVGGAQAIAAMAYGTKSIPKVDKIVGPGNIFVTAAKKLVYGEVGIDFLAGPSEVLIFAEKGKPNYIAADMLAQAEHDRLASAVFVTTNKTLAIKVKKEIESQLKQLSTRDIAQESLRNYGAIVLANSSQKAIDFINEFAPEHLEIMDEKFLPKISNAGAIFIGEYSCESAGDYAAGPSHVLPTLAVARYRAGLAVSDFIKMPSYQKLSKQGLKNMSKSIIDIANAEGLEAHAKAVEIRK